MKRYSILFVFSVFVAASRLLATVPSSVAQLPELGNPTIKVVGQNLENYLVGHLNHSNASCTTTAELVAKTAKIVDAFLTMDADIYAMVELEQADTALIYLTNALNAAAGGRVYDYVHDHVSDCGSNDSDYGSIMAGYIYKVSAVVPVGNDFALATQSGYKPRMRGQIFRQLSNDEQFILSINHFKAMSGQSNVDARKRNATELVSNLQSHLSDDPDVLIMGDLNCVTTEDAIQYLIAQGYSELTEYYDPRAYSYYYSGNELIDHAIANASMAQQVTGVGVYHINTNTRRNNTGYHYSDHDAVMVGLNLGGTGTTNCGLNITYDFTQGFGEFTDVNVAGAEAEWVLNRYNQYGLALNGQIDEAQEDWLISPEIDLSGMQSATLRVNHCIYKGSDDYEQNQTLWVTNRYTGDPTTTVWTQVVLNEYGTGSRFADATVSVPAECLTEGFRFAFRYTSSGNGNYWEIKNAQLTSVCDENHTALPSVIEEDDAILGIYSPTGIYLGDRLESLAPGLYIIRRTNSSQKLFIQ